jgi:hypothetical protein
MNTNANTQPFAATPLPWSAAFRRFEKEMFDAASDYDYDTFVDCLSEIEAIAMYCDRPDVRREAKDVIDLAIRLPMGARYLEPGYGVCGYWEPLSWQKAENPAT